MRLQYLGFFNGGCLFSDGVHCITAKVGRSYTNSFSEGLFRPLTIFTILECSRGPTASDVFFTNLLMAPKNEQIGVTLGKPKPYGV